MMKYCDLEVSKEEKNQMQNFDWRILLFPYEALKYTRYDTYYLVIYDLLRFYLKKKEILNDVLKESAKVLIMRYSKPAFKARNLERIGIESELDNRQIRRFVALRCVWEMKWPEFKTKTSHV